MKAGGKSRDSEKSLHFIGDIGPLKSYLESYLLDLRVHRRLMPSTIKVYEAELRKFLNILIELNPAESLAQVFSALKPATQWRKLVIWKSFLAEAPEEFRTILASIRPPKIRSKQPTFLTEDESFLLESICYKTQNITRNRLIIAFGLHLGLRISEITKLKANDIQGAWLRIIRKGDKEQHLPISASLLTLIRLYRAEFNLRDEDFLFAGRKGLPISSRSIQLLLKHLAKKAGIQKRISPHSLRHTFATTLAARGANLVALKELLGHERLSTTERYLHVTPSHLRETLNLLTQPRATSHSPLRPQ